MGTMLQKYGLSNSECPDYLNISHPEIVQRIHKEYEAAGCQFITTNTFGSSPLKLEDYNLQDKVEEIAKAAVKMQEKHAAAALRSQAIWDRQGVS